jgi:hypothetical protein
MKKLIIITVSLLPLLSFAQNKPQRDNSIKVDRYDFVETCFVIKDKEAYLKQESERMFPAHRFFLESERIAFKTPLPNGEYVLTVACFKVVKNDTVTVPYELLSFDSRGFVIKVNESCAVRYGYTFTGSVQHPELETWAHDDEENVKITPRKTVLL